MELAKPALESPSILQYLHYVFSSLSCSVQLVIGFLLREVLNESPLFQSLHLSSSPFG